MILDEFKKKKIVVFTGAGVSEESGIATFRSGTEKGKNLWDEYDPMVIAHIDTWNKSDEDKQMMLDFYNKRRSDMLLIKHNKGHEFITKLEDLFDVTVITQNVDDLHEKAGSTDVLHLHGELSLCKGSDGITIPYEKDIKLGDLSADETQIRPHVVFFGEDVPMYRKALEIIQECDLLIVAGTSLRVFPAADLVHAVSYGNKIIIVDKDPSFSFIDEIDDYYRSKDDFMKVTEESSTGMQKVFSFLKKYPTLEFPLDDE